MSSVMSNQKMHAATARMGVAQCRICFWRARMVAMERARSASRSMERKIAATRTAQYSTIARQVASKSTSSRDRARAKQPMKLSRKQTPNRTRPTRIASSRRRLSPFLKCQSVHPRATGQPAEEG